MFEFHGWAAVFDSLESNQGPADGLTQTAYDAVAAALNRVRNDWQIADLRVVNGSCHAWLAGYRNHRQDEVINVFREIATAAPWSYGILYVHDDEADDESNRWIAWVMKRGALQPHPDDFLSPHIGEVEDPLD